MLAHATAVGLAVAILRARSARWSRAAGRLADPRCHGGRAGWGQLIVWRLVIERGLCAQLPLLASAVVVTLLALNGTRLAARFRHGSQAFRLTLLTLALIAPAFAFYPTLFQLAWRAKSQLVETALRAAGARTAPRRAEPAGDEPGADRRDCRICQSSSPAEVTAPWTRPQRLRSLAGHATGQLSRHLVRRAVRRGKGQLVSRYRVQPARGAHRRPLSPKRTAASWLLIDVTNPFFAEERRILHAGRRLCGENPGESCGSIVVHAMLEDYENLPFIPSRSPYRGPGAAGRSAARRRRRRPGRRVRRLRLEPPAALLVQRHRMAADRATCSTEVVDVPRAALGRAAPRTTSASTSS